MTDNDFVVDGWNGKKTFRDNPMNFFYRQVKFRETIVYAHMREVGKDNLFFNLMETLVIHTVQESYDGV